MKMSPTIGAAALTLGLNVGCGVEDTQELNGVLTATVVHSDIVDENTRCGEKLYAALSEYGAALTIVDEEINAGKASPEQCGEINTYLKNGQALPVDGCKEKSKEALNGYLAAVREAAAAAGCTIE